MGRSTASIHIEKTPPKKSTAEQMVALKSQIGKLQAQLKKLEKQALPDDSVYFPQGTKRRALADQLKKLGAIDVLSLPSGMTDEHGEVFPKNSVVAYFKMPRG